MKEQDAVLTGWGMSNHAPTRVLLPTDRDEILGYMMSGADSRGTIARGLGRSYGDAAQRSGGTTLVVRTGEKPRWADRDSGLLMCPADATMADLIQFADLDGFFVPVTPGTKHVTVGGAIAADVHGKNHHAAGSFASHVQSMKMLLADGSIVEVAPDTTPELFWATAGGMGLTGIVLEAMVKMLRVPGNTIEVETTRTERFHATAEALLEADGTADYTVAWIDLASSGSGFGRGIVSSGHHHESRVETVLGSGRVAAPAWWRWGMVNGLTTRGFNELWFRKAHPSTHTSIEGYEPFFFPLDLVENWNRVYGHRGLLQYQFVADVSIDELEALARELCSAGSPLSLAVLKRFGAPNKGLLSFPMTGWTLAADMPIPRSPASLEKALRQIDDLVAQSGGRVYLAKDSRLTAEAVERMYPDIDSFRRIRRQYDPGGVFQSDLAERLRL